MVTRVAGPQVLASLRSLAPEKREVLSSVGRKRVGRPQQKWTRCAGQEVPAPSAQAARAGGLAPSNTAENGAICWPGHGHQRPVGQHGEASFCSALHFSSALTFYNANTPLTVFYLSPPFLETFGSSHFTPAL